MIDLEIEYLQIVAFVFLQGFTVIHTCMIGFHSATFQQQQDDSYISDES